MDQLISNVRSDSWHSLVPLSIEIDRRECVGGVGAVNLPTRLHSAVKLAQVFVSKLTIISLECCKCAAFFVFFITE